MRKILALALATFSVATFAMHSNAQSDEPLATVFTTNSYYAANESVTLTGEGWQPSEAVNITVKRERDGQAFPETSLVVLADAEGKLNDSQYATADGEDGVTYTVYARGSSSDRTAITAFLSSSAAPAN